MDFSGNTAIAGSIIPRLFSKLCMPAPESGRLIEMGGTPDGFLRVLASWENIFRTDLHHSEQLQDYFALCLACHHATVATFVPTDVDTKIRGMAWRETSDVEVLKPMLQLCARCPRLDGGRTSQPVRFAASAATTGNTGALSRADWAACWNSATRRRRRKHRPPSKRKSFGNRPFSIR